MNLLPAILSTALVLLAGAGHAVFTGRWTPPAEFGPVQARLDAVPTALGPWAGTPAELDVTDLKRFGIEVSLSREYRNPATGKAVSLLVVGGKPGPISVHTPDVCFQGAGYRQMGQPKATPLGPDGGRLWAAPFAKPNAAVPTRSLVTWGWDGGDGWQAPDHRTARVQYARLPALYKLYLVTDATTKDGADQPLADLAGRVLPAVHAALFPAPPG